MLTLQAVVLSLAALGADETILYDFTATWCGPCRQMEPTVQRLAQLGYPVKKVDIDQHRELASQYRVRGIPCFVLVVNGREVDRTAGATSLEQLQQMFARQHIDPKQAKRGPQSDELLARASTASGRDVERRPAAQSAQVRPASYLPDPALDVRLLAASVRLKINDPSGHSYGSGTIIDARGEEALILTCGHIFRDSQGKGEISVDLFGPDAPQGLPGKLIDYDLPSDVGLVSFRPGRRVCSARVAPMNYQVRRGDNVINIGCNNGKEPTVRHSRVTSLDKFVGPANLQVAGQPVVGRSGGGLFSADGLVIGVCNAADPADDEGLYAALPSIRGQLERAGLAEVYREPHAAPSSAIVRDRDRATWNGNLDRPPAMPDRMPKSNVDSPSPPVVTLAADHGTSLTPGQRTEYSPLRTEDRSTLAGLRDRADAAEVICIVRPLSNPQANSEVIVLNRASQDFLRQLSAEQKAQDARYLTSLDVGRNSAARAASAPAQGSLPRTESSPAATGSWQPNWQRPR